ncbi:RNA 2',3'-cyclic phosphodiesterase [Sneathiella sp.]|jgi:2'-5' RNA ligase|uniref:RNA 2',3'-cyclic phosphodiesterase n=1 Tax=Sneathiella sp. TaxID=1964365 RepID=UPI0039E5ACBF
MRLFVALSLPEDVKRRIETLRGGIPDARWISSENAHLTLSFIGEIPEAEILDIGMALSRISHAAFDVTIENVGVFGNSRRPRILWAGIKSSPDLMSLQQKVVKNLALAGFKLEDRRFKPHITLARIHMSPYEKVRQYLSDNALFRIPPVQVDHFTLFSSHLAHTGAIYTEEMYFDLINASATTEQSSLASMSGE